MPVYLTETALRARASGLTASAAQQRLRQIRESASGGFDVFLSHSFQDALLIYGIHDLLTKQGLSVYVDWIDDPQLDRSRVSAATAARLRDQMRRSKSLIYATSRAAQRSRWMPWELGFFDGFRDRNRISILPIEDNKSNTNFAGEEYLDLYKTIEQVNFGGIQELYVVAPSRRKAEPLRSFARSGNEYIDVS